MAAELHEFVADLPAGYDSVVGESGLTLSGGQRQRLALATAILTDPEILLLDDTTSALDAATEARIRETLKHVLKSRHELDHHPAHHDRARLRPHHRVGAPGGSSSPARTRNSAPRKAFYRTVCVQQEQA